MSTTTIEAEGGLNTERAIALLSRRPVENAWAIQDLSRFSDASKLYFVEDEQGLASSTSRATRRPVAAHPHSSLAAAPMPSKTLLEKHLPAGAWIMRETPADLAPVVRQLVPQAVVYPMRRMEVTRHSFKTAAMSFPTRQLVEADAGALAAFYGDPEGAAHGYKHWLRGGYVYGAFHGDSLGAIATAIVRSADAWILVGIETRRDLRGKGLGTAVTAAMTASALEQTKTVWLTVATENASALAVYHKLGFKDREERVWIDNGTGVGP